MLFRSRQEINMITDIFKPNINVEDIEGIDELVIGEFTTYFDSGVAGRTMNIKLSSDEIDRVILGPGVLGAFISLMIALTGDELRQIIGWLLGSLAMRGWAYVWLALPLFIIAFIMLLFNRGADDYIVKPFSPREVVLRVKALLRRSSSTKFLQTETQAKDMLVFQNLVIDNDAHRVTGHLNPHGTIICESCGKPLGNENDDQKQLLMLIK